MKTYDDVVDFHGHSCPGLALGYRVSLRALKEMKVRSADEEIVAVVENNSCAVDAVQVMTGCRGGDLRGIDCAACGEKMAEPKARMRNGRMLCIPCFEAKGESWKR